MSTTATPQAVRLTDFASCAGCAAKAPPLEMAKLLQHLPVARTADRDPRLLVGTETFDDAGVYQLTESLALVQTVDFFPPLVDDPFLYGQIAAANALSDVYAMGGEPKTALGMVCFPDDVLPMELLGRILAGGQDRLDKAGALLLGGHTVRDKEIKYGLAVTGLVDPRRLTPNSAAQPGDVLYLTKPLGTGFVTTANKRNQCPPELLAAAIRSMVELNASGALAMRELEVRAATDVTGFGLVGHAYELAAGSNVSMEIHLRDLPLLHGVEELVQKGFRTRASKTNREYAERALDIREPVDPIRLELLFDAQTSGGLLIAVPAEHADRAAEVLRRHGTLAVARIGQVTGRCQGGALVITD